LALNALVENNHRRVVMFLWIAIILAVLWLAGFLTFHAAGALIHIILILAIIALVWHFVAGRRV